MYFPSYTLKPVLAKNESEIRISLYDFHDIGYIFILRAFHIIYQRTYYQRTLILLAILPEGSIRHNYISRFS